MSWGLPFFQAIFIVSNILKSVRGNSASEHVILSPFVLRDLTDGKCFGEYSFARCSKDTLWFVTGKPGDYQLHHYYDTIRSPKECLCKANCLTDSSPLMTSSCMHCGCRFWNILGDSSSGLCTRISFELCAVTSPSSRLRSNAG